MQNPGSPDELSSLICCVALIVGIVLAVGVAARKKSPRPPYVLWPHRPDNSWRGRPEPRQIWWADVPFRDGTGSKSRPCLVIRTHPAHVEVLPITSQDKSHRHDHIEIPTKHWDRRAQYNSFLDISAPYTLFDDAFSRKAGRCDDGTWATVQQLHAVGWATPPPVEQQP